MQTVFSHIVQKRLSQESENVATSALAYILSSGERPRSALLRLLRGIVPVLPELWFREQLTADAARPDLWGQDERGDVHVLIENKFWAGLTDNQPTTYLGSLAKSDRPALLLFVVPRAREHAVWGELLRRLGSANVTHESSPPAGGVDAVVKTGMGPVLALTSWATIIGVLEAEASDDPVLRSDVQQLRSLCDQADQNAFMPFSAEFVSDQQIPANLLQLTTLVQDVAALASERGVLHLGRLKPQADASRIGRYVNAFAEERVGLWFGVHFGLWKRLGRSPLWLVFNAGDWGRAGEVRVCVEPWARQLGLSTAHEPDGTFAIAVDVPEGLERDGTIRGVVDFIGTVMNTLRSVPPKPIVAVGITSAASEAGVS